MRNQPVDGLNDVTTEKKGTATPLVDSLPEGPVKEALKARLDQVTTSEVTVNDADSNGQTRFPRCRRSRS
ncbi:GA-like domain-containing protein [Streptococcus agalactiae]|uniref:GA-like domain-containing protein n=1 Tax=Streptococcus agalactiae TaxID=1311 RepID=UPI000E06579C|nr:hypothetical protein [Streptococcus agalactiae]SUN26213.1 Uncharacterised protein [Streptococcus agalactiae]